MIVDFADIPRDCFGQIETPMLVLQTKSGSTICPLMRYFNFNMKFRFNEKSEIEFDIPAWADGIDTMFYDRIVPDMLVKVKHYGVFVIQSISTKGDGVKEIKSCTACSLEYELEGKQIAFGDGTYKFYDPIDPTDTILGICMESNRSWKIGSVPARLYSVYRTFKQTDTSALDFMLNQAQEPYQCAFVFDTFTRTVNVIDALDEIDTLPIYMSFDNLIKDTTITSKPDQFATRFTVNGADSVDIRAVNPTGTNQIINLSYWVEDGSIPDEIASRYRDWKVAIHTKQPYYTSLVALQNSTYGRYLTEKARLTDLEGELTSLDNLRTVKIQGLNMAKEEGGPTQEGTRKYFQAKLDEIAVQYTAKQAEIAEQKALLDSIKADYDQAGTDISAVNNELGFEKYFTQAELGILDHYLKDAKISDSTFAVFDVDISGQNDSFTKAGTATVTFKNVSIVDVNMDAATELRILDLSGGSLTITGDGYSLNASIVRGTFDKKNTGEVVFSAYLGSGTVNESSFPSGNLSCVGTSALNVDTLLAGMEKIVDTITDEETGVSYDAISYVGDGAITINSASIYFTRNVTEYQRYTVAQDLYEYAVEAGKKMAYPLYAFEVNSGNFIWAEKFEPFKNKLKLGGGIYLRLNDKTLLKPMLLEVHLDFENPSNFKLVFSSEFQTKWPDEVSSYKQMLKQSKDAASTLNFEKFKYNSQHLSGAAEAFENFWKNGMNSAYQQVTAGPEQNVVVNGAGIKVGTVGSNEYIMLSNGMIALVDDVKNAAKMAMGHFYSSEYGTDYYGVMADIIFGRLMTGNGLSIACPDINGGSMLFEADGKGVRLHNSRFSLDHDRGGQIILDPTVGIAIGKNGMFELDDDGRVVFNEDKANAYIDMNGKLCLKDIEASGTIYGSKITGSEIYIGGGNTAENCVFGVDALGHIKGLETANGKLHFDDQGRAYFDNDVSISGDLTLTGNINMSGGIVKWGANNIPNKQRFAASMSGPWHETMQSGDIYCCDWNYVTETWGDPYPKVGQDGRPGSDGSDGDPKGYLQSIKITEITENQIKSALIEGAVIRGGRLESETKIDVGTDANIGNNIYLGNQSSDTQKMIRFNGRANIHSFGGGLEAGSLRISCNQLDLDWIDNIYWGKNAPVAVFA